MKLSYEGIGQWAATFACDDLAEGELVKVSANGTVAACAAGDDFCGMVLSVGRGGDACAVALGGMVTQVPAYDGTVTADSLTPQKAKILLQLALAHTTDREKIQAIFDAY